MSGAERPAEQATTTDDLAALVAALGGRTREARDGTHGSVSSGVQTRRRRA